MFHNIILKKAMKGRVDTGCS